MSQIYEITYNTTTGECLGYVAGVLPDGCSRIAVAAADLGDCISSPEYYSVADLALVRKSQAEIDVIVAAKQQAVVDEADRVAAILAAQASAGLKNVTIDQAYAAIDTRMDAVTDLASLVLQTRTLLKKMVPYILK